MFPITDQELRDLIDKHNGKSQSRENTPIYDLKTVVEYGLVFLYGKMHLKDNKVVPCSEKLSLYRKHKCKKEGSKEDKKTNKTSKKELLEITEIHTLEKTRSTMKTCWTGSNLAVLTGDFTLQGYFKNDLLFQRKIPQASSMIAGIDKICVGLFTGEIVYFDPISQNEIVRPCHSDTVTSLYYENGHLLSSSLDGSIFYRKKMEISSEGVLDVCYVTDMKFLCACADNKLVFYDTGNIRTFVGHKDRIKSLSYDNFGISTSRNGDVGFLLQESVFEMANLGASLHRRHGPGKFFGYGLSEVFLYDVTRKQRLWSVDEISLNLTVKNEMVVYSAGTDLKVIDIRTHEEMVIPLGVNATDLSFSDAGDMLLVCTDQSPLILDLKHI